jgi:hypothetical protein
MEPAVEQLNVPLAGEPADNMAHEWQMNEMC